MLDDESREIKPGDNVLIGFDKQMNYFMIGDVVNEDLDVENIVSITENGKSTEPFLLDLNTATYELVHIMHREPIAYAYMVGGTCQRKSFSKPRRPR